MYTANQIPDQQREKFKKYFEIQEKKVDLDNVSEMKNLFRSDLKTEFNSKYQEDNYIGKDL